MELVQERRLATRDTDLPQHQVSDGTRAQILLAGLRLFAEHGFAGASIRDIAARAGVKSASLYAHFPSKMHVLAELTRIGHDEHHRRLRAALLDAGVTATEQLTALVRAHVRMHTDYAMLAMVANAELHALPPDLLAPAALLRRQSEQLLEAVIQRGVDRGEFHPLQEWLAMAAIGGMGLRVANWFTDDGGITAEEVARVYAAFALRIVGATGADTPDMTGGVSALMATPGGTA